MSKWTKRVLSALLTALVALLLLPTSMFSAVGVNFETHVIYAYPDAIVVEGSIAFPVIEHPMDGNPYSLFEIPEQLSEVIIVPLIDNATFRLKDGTSFSFGKINDDTIGIFTLATVGEDPTPPHLTITRRTQTAAQTYTVTINLNDGSVPATSVIVTQGDTYYALPAPIRRGYTFEGWYTEASGGSKVKSTDAVNLTGDITLYAHWTVANYTITFDPNGGSVSPASIIVTKDNPYITPPTPTRRGYTFDGWYTAANGGLSVDGIYPENLIENVTIYAHWTASPNMIFSTGYESNFWNWIKFIVLFGWAWMWF